MSDEWEADVEGSRGVGMFVDLSCGVGALGVEQHD
jgi:hypothetical protein